MSDEATLDEIKTFAAGLSPWAHIATIGADGAPDVVPVHPAWEGDRLWAMVFASSVTVRNVAANPQVAMHWQSGDRRACTRTSRRSDGSARAFSTTTSRRSRRVAPTARRTPPSSR